MASAGERNDPLRQVSELGFSCQLRKRYPRQQAAASIQRLRPQERSQENRLVTQPVRPSPDRRSRLHSESPVVRSRGPRHLTVGAGLNRPPETFPDEPCSGTQGATNRLLKLGFGSSIAAVSISSKKGSGVPRAAITSAANHFRCSSFSARTSQATASWCRRTRPAACWTCWDAGSQQGDCPQAWRSRIWGERAALNNRSSDSGSWDVSSPSTCTGWTPPAYGAITAPSGPSVRAVGVFRMISATVNRQADRTLLPRIGRVSSVRRAGRPRARGGHRLPRPVAFRVSEPS